MFCSEQRGYSTAEFKITKISPLSRKIIRPAACSTSSLESFKCYIPKTGKCCTSSSVTFFPVCCEMPLSSFALKRQTHDRILRRLISWKYRSAEGRMPSDPTLHALSNLMAKSLCLQATRLEAANRQTLEELIPKLLRILLHAEPPALLFYQEKRG